MHRATVGRRQVVKLSTKLKAKTKMELRRIMKIYTFLMDVLIISTILSPLVNSLPFLDEIKNRSLNSNFIKSLNEQTGDLLSVSSDNLINLQKTRGFDLLKAEENIESIFNRLQNLFYLPFNHPTIQETKNESEIYRGDCLAPTSCFQKIQGSNLCTVCEEDMSAAADLIDFFQEAENASELLDMGENCKHVLNEYLFNYALTYMLITKFPDVEVPHIIEVFPNLFIKKDELNSINEEVVKKQRQKRMTDRIVVHVRPEVDSTSPTHLTEDYGYNSNHWNWHIVHRPFSNIDRRGELFWYMHHQMLARYDIERLSLGLNRVESSGPLNRTLTFGFSPNLSATQNGQEWASRPDNTTPTSIRRNGIVVHDKDELVLWHARLSEAAKNSFFINENNENISLSDDTDVNNNRKRGIDIFTAALEADPETSPNFNYYGFLHNHGHRIIARLHDPESQGSLMGTMGNAAVAGRDPSFYEWHKYVEEVIQEYKRTQTPYTQQRLQLENIYLSGVQIAIDSEGLSSYKQHVNSEYNDSKILEDAENGYNGTELLTGCNTYGVDISRGLDFQHIGNEVVLEITHLDHIPFYYNIYVFNDNFVSRSTTVRIFMAPMFNSEGQRIELHEQQHLFIIIDKFRYTVHPGENVIHRLSTESSITSNCRTSSSRRDSERESFSRDGVFGGGHCGCGWPHHLLLPRGTYDGMMFQIFVMLTDGDEDYVLSQTEVKEFCGTSGEKYPDWQPMGYPFDRPFHPEIHYVDQLANYFNMTNAHVSNVSIRFTGRNILTDGFTC